MITIDWRLRLSLSDNEGILNIKKRTDIRDAFHFYKSNTLFEYSEYGFQGDANTKNEAILDIQL